MALKGCERRHLCLLKPGNRCFWYPGKVVGQQVARAGLLPLGEVNLFKLAVVPSLHDLQIFIADVLDRVPEALRYVGNVARLELLGRLWQRRRPFFLCAPPSFSESFGAGRCRSARTAIGRPVSASIARTIS